MRLSTGQFAALGLITFWIYPALRMAHALHTHFALRWMEIEARGELRASDPRLAALRATGFNALRWPPWSAAALFAAAALLAGLHNAHLAEEKRHEVTAPLAGGAAGAGGDERPRRARVAIMLTDMQDYSKAMGLDESGAYALRSSTTASCAPPSPRTAAARSRPSAMPSSSSSGARAARSSARSPSTTPGKRKRSASWCASGSAPAK